MENVFAQEVLLVQGVNSKKRAENCCVLTKLQ